jgi:uncharacterized membrane protein
MRAERGQTSLLIVGFAVVIAMLVAVVVDASAAYLRRQSLDALADGAALAAADGVGADQVYEGGLGARAGLDPVQARGRVASYLAQTGASRQYPGLSYSVSVGADVVVVRVVAPLELPLHLPGRRWHPLVSGTAASYVDVGG